jgi:hypothetical protein
MILITVGTMKALHILQYCSTTRCTLFKRETSKVGEKRFGDSKRFRQEKSKRPK